MKPGDIYRRGSQLFTVVAAHDGKVKYRTSGGREYKRSEHTFERDFSPVDMELARSDTIEVGEDDMEPVGVHSDAGGHGSSFTCPVCHGGLTYARHGWWSMRCACRSWTVDIKAVGTRRDQ